MTLWVMIALVTAPMLAALGSLLARDRQLVDVLQGAQALTLLAGATLITYVTPAGEAPTGLFGQFDAMSAWFDVIVGVVGASGTVYAVGYMGERMGRNEMTLGRYRRFFCLFDLYLAAMMLAVNVGDVALMWIALEASTLCAAVLIGYERNKAALEAGWKFLILSSVGIALALFGTILVYYSSEHVLGVTSAALQWSELRRVAEELNPQAIKIAWIFLLVGYGTKAGLAPMHSWLPDAHAEAPTPVSAMLSANQLTVAVYALLRFKAIVDVTVGSQFTGRLMIGLGLLSVGIACAFLLVQRDYKRLFAYSSIEHIGIAFIGFGIGGLGVAAGAWHLLNHALAKSTAFYATGLVHLRHEHKMIERVPGLLNQMPLAGSALLIAGLALSGMPPFGLFVSELLIVAQSYAVAPATGIAFLALLSLAFATLMYQMLRMAFGVPEKPGIAIGARCRRFTTVAIVMNVAALVGIGLQMPLALRGLLASVAAMFGTTLEGP